jgi:hypothetical protein
MGPMVRADGNDHGENGMPEKSTVARVIYIDNLDKNG